MRWIGTFFFSSVVKTERSQKIAKIEKKLNLSQIKKVIKVSRAGTGLGSGSSLKCWEKLISSKVYIYIYMTTKVLKLGVSNKLF